MHLASILFAIPVCVQHAAASTLPIYAHRNPFPTPNRALSPRGNIFGQSTLTNTSDFNYYTNITLNGQSYAVLIDTGSSDLWVSGTVPSANDTGFTAGVNYAIGSVEGKVMTADLEFAGYTVKSQAFLQVSPSSSNPSSSGLIGLGPNNGSSIFSATNDLSSADAPLDRIFRQNTSTPNFLSVLLGRKDDPSDDFPGNLTVGSYLAGYESISSQPHLAVTEVDLDEFRNQHWSTLLDANGIIGPNGKKITTTSTVNETKTPNQLNIIFDTGFSIPQVPKAVADAIYSDVSGARFTNVKGVGDIWVLDCDKELNVTFVFGGKNFSIHPLDVVLDVGFGDGSCVGGFQPMSTSTGGLFDAILGMAFLRNAYLLINFGDFVDDSNSTTADPFIQLLSITNDTAEMHSDFVKVRSTTTGSSGSSWWGAHRALVIVILAAILVAVILMAGLRKMRSRKQRGAPSNAWKPASAGTYIPLGAPAPPPVTDMQYPPPPPYAQGNAYAPPPGPPPGGYPATGSYAPPPGPPPANTGYADPFHTPGR